MVAVIQTCQLFEHTNLRTPFNPIHLTLAGDMKEVFQHPPTRSRLELILLEIRYVLAILATHDPLSSQLIFSDD